ncbi:hypothetical protein NHX12_002383 [Muraenolepis orangiensis]|uniref:Uncharacterized protein n=1 Tax=Muraenolepis orangiensis TaxID=630683 RepID=A0A9Q0IEP7_9TELE|nr:hypothetical protein NHX12_002383 [Muraenolepis orangiensis]
MVLFGEEVPSFQPHSKPPLCAVRVSRTVVVEPGREYLVPGCTRFKRQFKGEVMLSPTKGFVEKHRLLVARALVEAQCSKTVPLRIFNPGNTSITIKEGAIAGVLQHVRAVQTAPTTDQPGQTIIGIIGYCLPQCPSTCKSSTPRALLS